VNVEKQPLAPWKPACVFDFLEELIFALHHCCAIEATIKFHSIGQVDYTQAFQATSLNGAAMLRQRLSDAHARP
jgi:hypothetical protein